MVPIMDCPQYTTKLCFVIIHTSWTFWKLGYFSLLEIIVRLTVCFTKASLTQSVAVIVMSSVCLFDIMFIQIFCYVQGTEIIWPWTTLISELISFKTWSFWVLRYLSDTLKSLKWSVKLCCHGYKKRLIYQQLVTWERTGEVGPECAGRGCL